MSIPSISSYTEYFRQYEYNKKINQKEPETSIYLKLPTADEIDELDAVKTSHFQELKAQKYASDSKIIDAKNLPWYPVLVQLGITPSGDAKTDYTLIMFCLNSKIDNAKNQEEAKKYENLMKTVHGIFVQAGVTVDELEVNQWSKESKLEKTLMALSNYNKMAV